MKAELLSCCAFVPNLWKYSEFLWFEYNSYFHQFIKKIEVSWITLYLFFVTERNSFSPSITNYPRPISLSAEEVVLRPSYSFEEYRPFWTWWLSERKIWKPCGGKWHKNSWITLVWNIPCDTQSLMNPFRKFRNISKVQTSISFALVVGIRCIEPRIPKPSAADFMYFLKPFDPDSEARSPLMSYRNIVNSIKVGGCGGSCWTAGKAPVMKQRNMHWHRNSDLNGTSDTNISSINTNPNPKTIH